MVRAVEKIAPADGSDSEADVIPRVARAFARIREEEGRSPARLSGAGPSSVPRTPKRGRDDGPGPSSAAKQAKGSAGRTPIRMTFRVTPRASRATEQGKDAIPTLTQTADVGRRASEKTRGERMRFRFPRSGSSGRG